jgi:hypothetical protein
MAQSHLVVLLVGLDCLDPLAGSVALEGARSELAFCGWADFMAAVSDLSTQATRRDGQSGRDHGSP